MRWAERRLRSRVRALERRVEELEGGRGAPRFKGAVLTAEVLADYYQSLRSKGHRFVVLRVHPELQDTALELISAVGDRGLRGLREVQTSEDVPECGWEVVPG